MMVRSGKPIAPALLPERIRKMSEDMQKAQQEAQQQQEQMQKQLHMADIDKTDSETSVLDSTAAVNEAKRQKLIVETELLPFEMLSKQKENQGGSPLDQLK